MPRGPRIAFENSFYHVFNRGINKERIFFSDIDYQFFLKKLKNLQEKYDHSLYAFCLMPNHFHLSIRTRKSPISKILSSLTTSYSMYFNRTHHHFGPVFQNRFKSLLVQTDPYFIKLSQYIYNNPVKAGLVKDPLLYPYSSIREALGKEPLSLLDHDIIRLVGKTKHSLHQYQEYIYQEAQTDLHEIESIFEKEEVILGSRLFSSLAQKKYIRRHNKNGS